MLLLGGEKFRKLGPVTPMGGAVMIAGCVTALLCLMCFEIRLIRLRANEMVVKDV